MTTIEPTVEVLLYENPSEPLYVIRAWELLCYVRDVCNIAFKAHFLNKFTLKITKIVLPVIYVYFVWPLLTFSHTKHAFGVSLVTYN